MAIFGKHVPLSATLHKDTACESPWSIHVLAGALRRLIRLGVLNTGSLMAADLENSFCISSLQRIAGETAKIRNGAFFSTGYAGNLLHPVNE